MYTLDWLIRICVTWFICICLTWPIHRFMTRLNRINGTWIIHMCDRLILMCVTWLICVCGIVHLMVGHDSFVHVTRLIHMFDMTHFRAGHNSFKHVWRDWFVYYYRSHVCCFTHIQTFIHIHTHTHTYTHTHTHTRIHKHTYAVLSHAFWSGTLDESCQISHMTHELIHILRIYLCHT